MIYIHFSLEYLALPLFLIIHIYNLDFSIATRREGRHNYNFYMVYLSDNYKLASLGLSLLVVTRYETLRREYEGMSGDRCL